MATISYMSGLSRDAASDLIKLYPPKALIDVQPGDEFRIAQNEKPKMVNGVWVILLNIVKKVAGKHLYSPQAYKAIWEAGEGVLFQEGNGLSAFSFHPKWSPEQQLGIKQQKVLFSVFVKVHSTGEYCHFNIGGNINYCTEEGYNELVNERIGKAANVRFEPELKVAAGNGMVPSKVAPQQLVKPVVLPSAPKLAPDFKELSPKESKDSKQKDNKPLPPSQSQQYLQERLAAIAAQKSAQAPVPANSQKKS